MQRLIDELFHRDQPYALELADNAASKHAPESSWVALRDVIKKPISKIRRPLEHPKAFASGWRVTKNLFSQPKISLVPGVASEHSQDNHTSPEESFMRPYLVAVAAFVALSSRPLDSFAQEASCPDDAWICPQENAVIIKPDQAPGQVIIIIPPSAQVTTAPPVVAPPVVAPPPPPAARPAPMPKCNADPPAVPARVIPAKRTKRVVQETSPSRRTPQRGGIGLHLSRYSFVVDPEDGATNLDASMWGGGIDMRFFLRPNLEFNISTDLVIGEDYHGFDRFQQDLSLYFVRHFNHDSRLRFYALGGGNIGMGAVTSDKPSPLLPKQNMDDDLYYANYGMAGGQIGLGAELRLGKTTSARITLVGMHQIRFASTDDAPESTAPVTGGPINTLSGVLVRTGLSFGELW